jgi:hypothetical protein
MDRPSILALSAACIAGLTLSPVVTATHGFVVYAAALTLIISVVGGVLFGGGAALPQARRLVRHLMELPIRDRQRFRATRRLRLVVRTHYLARWWRRAARADRGVAIALAITLAAAGFIVEHGVASGAFVEDFRIEYHKGR